MLSLQSIHKVSQSHLAFLKDYFVIFREGADIRKVQGLINKTAELRIGLLTKVELAYRTTMCKKLTSFTKID